MNTQSFYDTIYAVIHDAALSLGHPVPSFVLEWKHERTFGDYSTNIAFSLAPHLKKNPHDIAIHIQQYIQTHHADIFRSVEIAGGGFINLFCTDAFLSSSFSVFQKKSVASFFSEPKKIVIEFSSPNIAKPMHVGHLRATLLGDFLARLHSAIGNSVIRWNHLGDWGTQFGKLLYGYKHWDEKKETVADLEKLYIQFHKKSETDPVLEDEARKEFLQLEQGNNENRNIWKHIVSLSLKEFQKTYALLSISFDIVLGESFYEKYVPYIFSLIEKSGKSQISDNALIIDLEPYDLPPGLLKKSDGATLYLTRDLASLYYRSTRFSPDTILYVVGNEQSLHFKQLHAVAKEINLPHAPFTHVPFGTVLNKDGKRFSTRSGRTVHARDLIIDVIEQARIVGKEKESNASQKTIEAMGIAALKYGMLSYNKTSPVTFDPENMLSMTGNSAPYIQYTYARARRIVDKTSFISRLLYTPRTYSPISSSERALIRSLLEYPAVIDRCVTSSTSQHLTEYLYELSGEINAFYEKERVLGDDDKKRMYARINLLKRASSVLKEGLFLLGIESPSVI